MSDTAVILADRQVAHYSGVNAWHDSRIRVTLEGQAAASYSKQP